MGKLKLKNTVTIQQEKLFAEKEEKLQKEQKELQDVGQSLRIKEQEVVNILYLVCVDYLQSLMYFLIYFKHFYFVTLEKVLAFSPKKTWLQSTELNKLFQFEKLVIMTQIRWVFIYVCVYIIMCTYILLHSWANSFHI